MSTRSIGRVIYNSLTMQHTGCGRRIRAALAAAGAVSVVLWIASPEAGASGASPYLPLNLSPEIERQVERVLVLTRPVPIATVLEALPKACKRDAVLCRQVKHYLDRYFGPYGVTEGSVEVAAPTHSTTTDPNQRGERLDSPFDASVVAYYRPYDHLLITAGGGGYAGT